MAELHVVLRKERSMWPPSRTEGDELKITEKYATPVVKNLSDHLSPSITRQSRAHKPFLIHDPTQWLLPL